MKRIFSRNTVRERLASGELQRGIFFLSGSTVIAEVVAQSGFDWLIIDEEASPYGNGMTLPLLQALNGSELCPFVRVPRLETAAIEHALDLGAQGILVPKVENAEDAVRAVNAMYYPPKGRRGLNPVRCSNYFHDFSDYIANANENILSLVQIESVQAVNHIEEILDTEHLDGVFVGPGDLSMDAGHPGDVDSTFLREARKSVADAARRKGKIAGIFAYSQELARAHILEGFTFLALANDIKLMSQACGSSLE